MKYIDVHAHYDDEAYNDDLNKELIEIKKSGVDYIINSGSGLEESKKAVEIANENEGIYATIGLHPYMVEEANKLKELEEIYEENKESGKIVGVGEIGLDYHITKKTKKEQIELFKAQLELAVKLRLPVQIHSREAAEDTLKVLRSVDKLPEKIMFHCFDLNEELAREIIKKGYSISVGGNITYKRTEQAISVLKSIPIDKIMTETDAPYLAPTGQRGKRNSSKYIGLIVERVSHIKGMDKEKTAQILYNNAVNFYNLK